MVTLLLMTSFAFATDDVQTAKVLAVKAHENGRIAYWEGRVAIYDGYPFFDITLSLGQKKYVVRCESLTGFYPSSWKVGREIQVRMLGKGKMYLINGAEEVLAGTIMRAHKTACPRPASQPCGGRVRKCLAIAGAVILAHPQAAPLRSGSTSIRHAFSSILGIILLRRTRATRGTIKRRSFRGFCLTVSG